MCFILAPRITLSVFKTKYLSIDCVKIRNIGRHKKYQAEYNQHSTFISAYRVPKVNSWCQDLCGSFFTGFEFSCVFTKPGEEGSVS